MDTEQFHRGVRIFSGKTAFRAESVKDDGIQLLVLEGASGSPNKYNWQNKIRIHVMERELPEIAAVLIGLRKQALFEFHGEAKNKSYYVMRKGTDVLMGVKEAGRAISGKVEPQAVFYLASFVISLLATNARTSPNVVTELLKISFPVEV
jgi:hypothetical protein